MRDIENTSSSNNKGESDLISQNSNSDSEGDGK